MPADIKWLNDRYSKLYADAANFRNLWRLVNQYFRVNANYIDDPAAPPGKSATNCIFDSSPVDAADKLTAFIWSNIAPQSSKWFIPTFGEEELSENEMLTDWMEKKGDQMLKQFRIDGFYPALHQAIKDTVVSATGCIFIDEKPIREGFQGIDFKVLPVGTYVLAQNFSGVVDTLFRKLPLTSRNIVEYARTGKYGFKESRLPSKIIDSAAKTPDEPFLVMHSVYPRTDTAPPYPIQERGSNLYFPWAAVYSWEESILAEGGYQEFPFAVTRYTVDPGEVYGRGPAFTALPDAIQLNSQAELRVKILEKIYAPPTIGRDTYIVDGDVQNFPGGHTRVSSTFTGALKDAFTTLDLNEDVAKMLLCEERLIQSINRIFFMDQIAAISSEENPGETATRTYLRWLLYQQMLGPAAGNFEGGLLQGTIQRAFNIMYRAGEFGRPPMPLMGEREARGQPAKQTSLSIRFDSPFARAQRAGDVEAFTRWMSRFLPLAEAYPQVIDIPDMDVAMRESAQIEGVPGSWVKDKDVVEEERAVKEQTAADDKAKMEAALAAEALGKAAPAIQAIPAMEGMMKGAQA